MEILAISNLLQQLKNVDQIDLALNGQEAINKIKEAELSDST